MPPSTQFLIAALQNVTVTEDLGRGDRIAGEIFLTNNQEVVRSHITPYMMAAFGGLEIHALTRSGLVAYKLHDTDAAPTSEAANVAVLSFLAELKNLQTALWWVRDNAISFENALLEWPHRTVDATMSMNTWSGLVTNCAGMSEIVSFTRDELRKARQTHGHIWDRRNPPNLKPTEPTQPDFDRLSRAFYFLQGARSSPALSLKVAMYCSAYESLLTTESTELSHKLAERLAWLVAASPQDRLQVFKAVKSAYSIRSKVVHGSAATKKRQESELVEASQNCDDLLRSLLSRLTSHESLQHLYVAGHASSAELEEALLRITLGE
jgi:Apea-like HEPN